MWFDAIARTELSRSERLKVLVTCLVTWATQKSRMGTAIDREQSRLKLRRPARRLISQLRT
jgi:hypothetical protein